MKKYYKYLPLFLQNLAITVKNNHSYYQKYGAIPFINPLYKIVNRLSVDNQINDGNVVERINNLINHAIENTNYYKENKHYYPNIKTLEEIRNLPVLKKEILKKQNVDFISLKSNFLNSYSFKTSGSTGTPLKGKIALKDLRKRFLVVLAALKSEGIDYSKTVARFPGANIGDSRNVFRIDFINNHYLFSIYNISQSNIKKYYNAFIKNKIQIVEGYPSTIYSLVKLFKLNHLKIESVKHVITTAEQLLDYQKQEIEDFFHCKVFDYYGSSEGSAFIYLTSIGTYINANKIGFIEIVDENYNPVKNGEFGRILVTSFTSTFTPLIRYDIGDYCSASFNAEIYSSKPLYINKLGGRSEDIFITEDGTYFSRFSLCLKYLPDYVIESQLILQQRCKNVTLKYIAIKKDSEINQKDFKPFIEKFESMLGKGYRFNFEKVQYFDKSSRGKLRAVKIIDNGE
ncbi:MAG: phenylacetate--CoA ligase family protein [Bacteroidales bacterium]|nr:phenylacetate--CoA ligase family protein [Bacteroidales bacterium]